MTLPYTYLDLFSSLPEITIDTIVSRTIFNDDQMKAVLFGFAAGQELSEHTASMPAVIHILTGAARLTLGGDIVEEANAGAWVRLPANLPHSVFAKTPVVLLLLLLKSNAT